ncbi:hypothetical protein [Maribacter aestuarii]|uniref:hypothetical protein n=1 Tax=Maribacter aestuarii TaxID=1130723 RepID=UPI00248B1B3B|nr:hypothetical protein [Maribacter aestuarii]
METSNKSDGLKEVNAYLVRIERSYRNLLQFKEQLSSYLFEPCTVDQYKEREELKKKIAKLSKGHLALLEIYRNNKNSLNQHLSNINEQLKEAKRLEEGIMNYMAILQRKLENS